MRKPCLDCHLIHSGSNIKLTKTEKAYNAAVMKARKDAEQYFEQSVSLARQLYEKQSKQPSSAPAKE